MTRGATWRGVEQGPEMVLAVGIAVAGAAWVWPGFLNTDAVWALYWGGEIRSGQAPTYERVFTATPHPLLDAVATIVGWAGSDFGYHAMLAIGWLAFVGLLLGVLRLGIHTVGRAPAVVAMALVALSPILFDGAATGVVDTSYAALVIWAAAEATRAGERSRRVLVLLALAGLLRPEAWLFSAAYWLYLVAVCRRRSVSDLVLAAAAPILWMLHDLVLTGNPIYFLTFTRTYAQDLGRSTGLTAAPGALWSGLRAYVSGPVAALGVAGLLAAALIRRGPAVKLLVIAALFLAAYMLLAASGGSLLVRYLAPPAVVLALGTGFALTGWTAGAVTGARRIAWAALAVLLAAVMTPSTLRRAEVLPGVAEAVKRDHGFTATLSSTVATVPPRCAIVAPDPKPRLVAAYLNGDSLTRYRLSPRPAPVALLVSAPPAEVHRGRLFGSDHPARSDGHAVSRDDGRWALAGRCP